MFPVLSLLCVGALLQAVAATINYQDPGWGIVSDKCYGSGLNNSDAICALAGVLTKPCYDLWSQKDDFKGCRKCQCEGGYISTLTVCEWCQKEFVALEPTDLASEDFRKDCSYFSFSVAPIPTSVVSRYSRWNATYSGNGRNSVTATSFPALTALTAQPTSRSLADKVDGRSGMLPVALCAMGALLPAVML